METWWRVGKYDDELIKRTECSRSTEHSLFYLVRPGREQRMAKRSEYATYFPTWAEARDFLIGRAFNQRNDLLDRVEYLEAVVAKLRVMSEPQGGAG